MAQQLLHIRLESDIYDRVKAEADRQDLSVAEFVRRAVEKALSPAQPKAPLETPPADFPALQALASGITREAASRGLSEKMIVQLWLDMMRPGLLHIAKRDQLADGLKLNLKISDESKDTE